MTPLKDLTSGVKTKSNNITGIGYENYKSKVLSARKHAFAEIMSNLEKYSIATISACRGFRREAYTRYREENGLSINEPAYGVSNEVWSIDYIISKQENLRRQKELQLKLYKAGLLGITPIYGCYKEEGSDKYTLEESFICFHKDYLYLMDTICKLGTLFEQDAVCVLKPNGERGLLLKTSPKDINAEPKVKLYQPFAYFKGFDAEESSSPEKSLQECFSRVNNSNFWWKFNDNIKLNSYRIITNLTDALPGLYPTEYKTLSIQAYSGGRDYTAPNEVITTKRGIFSAWYDLQKPHRLRTKLHELILKAMVKDERSVALKIEAAGLSHIYKYTQEHDTGTISAFRPEFSRGENLTRSSILGGLLRKRGYTTIQVQGIYQYEDGDDELVGKESSFFVVDKHNNGRLLKTLIELGVKFEQESISYADKGQDFALYATNSKEYRTGEKMATFKGKKFGQAGVSYSAIRGRPFAWDNYKSTKIESSALSSICKGRFTPNGALTRDVLLYQFEENMLGAKNIKSDTHLTDYVKAMKKNLPDSLTARFFTEDCEL